MEAWVDHLDEKGRERMTQAELRDEIDVFSELAQLKGYSKEDAEIHALRHWRSSLDGYDQYGDIVPEKITEFVKKRLRKAEANKYFAQDPTSKPVEKVVSPSKKKGQREPGDAAMAIIEREMPDLDDIDKAAIKKRLDEGVPLQQILQFLQGVAQ
jgi:hypothetical protein